MNYPEIIKYKGCGSAKLNRGLMQERAEFCIKDLEIRLNKELNNLGNHNYPVLYAHDGITHIPYDILCLWYKKQVGKVLMFPNFLSTSTYKWKKHETVYKINPLKKSRGKDLYEAIGQNGEKEVLYKSRTKFRIINIHNEIELDEYDGNDLDFVLYESFFLNVPEIIAKNKTIANWNNRKCKSFLD